MLKRIMSKIYGEGKCVEYDPRFPGYFSGQFIVKNNPITINNIRFFNLDFVEEENFCKCIKDFGSFKENDIAKITKVTSNSNSTFFIENVQCDNIEKHFDISTKFINYVHYAK